MPKNLPFTEYLEDSEPTVVIWRKRRRLRSILGILVETAKEKSSEVTVIDWHGDLNFANEELLDPSLPYAAVSSFIPRILASEPRYREEVEAALAEAVKCSSTAMQALSRLAIENGSASKIAYHRLSTISPFLSSSASDKFRLKGRVDLSLAPVTCRRTLLRLWIALASSLAQKGQTVVIDESGKALENCKLIVDLFDEITARGAWTILVDRQLRSEYIGCALIVEGGALDRVARQLGLHIQPRLKSPDEIVIIDGNRVLTLRAPEKR